MSESNAFEKIFQDDPDYLESVQSQNDETVKAYFNIQGQLWGEVIDAARQNLPERAAFFLEETRGLGLALERTAAWKIKFTIPKVGEYGRDYGWIERGVKDWAMSFYMMVAWHLAKDAGSTAAEALAFAANEAGGRLAPGDKGLRFYWVDVEHWKSQGDAVKAKEAERKVARAREELDKCGAAEVMKFIREAERVLRKCGFAVTEGEMAD